MAPPRDHAAVEAFARSVGQALFFASTPLASVYTGYMSPEGLLAVGLIEGPRADLARLGALFAGPAPWMPDMF